MKKLPIAIICFLLVFMSSCKKEEPVGTVVHSRTFTVAASQWVWNSANYLYYVDLPYPEITSALLPNAAVVGYKQASNPELWLSMPNTFYPIIGSSLSYTWEIAYVRAGTVRIRFVWSDSRQQAPTSTEVFRIVAVGK